MKILINAVAASSGGALTILKSFYNSVSQYESKEIEWVFLVNDNYIEPRKNVEVVIVNNVKKSWISRLAYDFLTGKKIVEKFQPNIIFSLQNTIIYGTDVEQVIYLHQPIPYQNVKKFSFLKQDERTLAIYQYLIGKLIDRSLLKSKYIIVQTHWLKNAVIEKLSINESEILVYPPNPNNYNKAISNNYQYNLFIYPASKISYKNHSAIYEAVKILNSRGYTDFTVLLTIEEEVEFPNILHVGNLDHEKVIDYFSFSTLIFPSYIETFGLPMQEARTVGNIVLASKTPFSKEILNDYNNAYFFNYEEPKELANLMMKVLDKEIVVKNIRDNPKNEQVVNNWEKIIDLLNEASK